MSKLVLAFVVLSLPLVTVACGTAESVTPPPAVPETPPAPEEPKPDQPVPTDTPADQPKPEGQ